MLSTIFNRRPSTSGDVDSAKNASDAHIGTKSMSYPVMKSGLTAEEIRGGAKADDRVHEVAATGIVSAQLDDNGSLPITAHSEPMYNKPETALNSLNGSSSTESSRVLSSSSTVGLDRKDALVLHADDKEEDILHFHPDRASLRLTGSNHPSYPQQELSHKQQQQLGMYTAPAETTRAYTRTRFHCDMDHVPSSRSVSQPSSPRQQQTMRARSSSLPTVGDLSAMSDAQSKADGSKQHSRMVSMTDADWKPLLSHESYDRPEQRAEPI